MSADPELVRSEDLVVQRHVRVDRTVVIAVGRHGVPAFLPWIQAVLGHDPPHFLRVHPQAAVPKLGCHPSIAVAVAGRRDVQDLDDGGVIRGTVGLVTVCRARQGHEVAPAAQRMISPRKCRHLKSWVMGASPKAHMSGHHVVPRHWPESNIGAESAIGNSVSPSNGWRIIELAAPSFPGLSCARFWEAGKLREIISKFGRHEVPRPEHAAPPCPVDCRPADRLTWGQLTEFLHLKRHSMPSGVLSQSLKLHFGKAVCKLVSIARSWSRLRFAASPLLCVFDKSMLPAKKK